MRVEIYIYIYIYTTVKPIQAIGQISKSVRTRKERAVLRSFDTDMLDRL